MKRHNPTLALGAIVVLVLSSVASLAQQTLDRTKVPPPGPSPVLRVPTWTKTQLSDGATLIVSERHNLPLISFTITFLGGANQFEPEAKRGVASLTTSMLTEGTTTKTGDQLSDALQLLGTNLSANIGAEEGSFGFVSTTKNFEPTLDLVEDMMLNSTFPAGPAAHTGPAPSPGSRREKPRCVRAPWPPAGPAIGDGVLRQPVESGELARLRA